MATKLKTKKSLSKRLKKSASGKLFHFPTFSGCKHIRTKKSAKRKRNFRKAVPVNSCDVKRIKRLVPYL